MVRFTEHDLDGGLVRLDFAGRFDSSGVDAVQEPLASLIGRRSGNVLMDITQVSFVGSLGLRLLISTARDLVRQGRRMALFGAQPQIAEVFEIVALSDLIPTHRTEAEALAALGAR